MHHHKQYPASLTSGCDCSDLPLLSVCFWPIPVPAGSLVNAKLHHVGGKKAPQNTQILQMLPLKVPELDANDGISVMINFCHL